MRPARRQCTCHQIPKEQFRQACAQGAHNVKTCFKKLGCLPRCNNCIPMVRAVLAEADRPGPSLHDTLPAGASNPNFNLNST
jgi:bacterioferritin-associated ferredoxin